MTKRRMGKKRGFSILSKTSVKGGRLAKKSHRKDDEIMRSISLSNSDSYGQRHEDHSNSDAEADQEEEMVVHREPSIYDNLLMTLGSGSQSVANASKMSRNVEKSKSDLDEDRGNDLESASISEEDEDGITDISEDDGDEGTEMDGEGELTANGRSIAIASANTSSFEDHLEYKLSKEEADSLLNMKWKYKWQVSTIDLSNCKWMTTSELLPEDTNMKSCYGLMPSLYDHWLEIYKESGGHDFHSSKQRSFFSLCNSYQDVLHHNKKPFYLKGKEDDSSIMDAYIMHSLNHVFRTRDLVTKNDKKLAKRKVNAEMELLNSDIFLDHGFTRPKILILLPLASFAFRVIKRMIQLTPSGNKANVEHFGRLSVDFGSEGSHDQEDEDKIDNSISQKTVKPSDFQSLFSGNNNDHFMIGIKFTKRSIKLYSDFYTSDIIVASPLGLITKIGESEAEKEKDVDYLSSIEVLIVDHADVIKMQNWSHVNTVVEHLNKIPSKQHKTDIMRIRQWYLEGLAQFYRQTIILGSYVNPDINDLFSKRCHNYRGKMKLFCDHRGVLPKVLLQVRQIYERFDAESILDDDNARLEYFSTKVFPKIKDSLQGGVMIFISSYFEFVRVRNFLRRQEASVCLLGEYTKQSDISRARVWFFQGKRKIMLYTERAHFYHRYKIRGIQNLIIYSLPERKEFYPEIVNMLEGDTMMCTVLFSRFDLLRLERIVGTTAAKRMVTSEKRVFTFC